MMLDADRTKPERPGPEGPDASTAPIVIVQRVSSGWGRELLLLVLLLGTVGYITYREYRLPRFLDRGEVRADSRVVDAAKVAPIAEGEVVLRAGSPAGDRDVRPAEYPAGSRPRGAATPADPVEADATGPIAADPDSEPESGRRAAGAPEMPPAPIGSGKDSPEGGFASPSESEDHLPDVGPASREIVWDLDLRGGRAGDDRPGGEAAAGPILDHPSPLAADRAPVPPTEFRPPTRMQRQHFLRCLAVAIQREGLRAGPQIDGICQDFGIGLPIELDAVAERLGPNFLPAGWDIDRTVVALRRIGVPEPYLLDRLTEQMNRTIGARHGPRDRMEARVFAARRLLSIPLEPGG
ncbi:hypothetical protein [Tautonia plasticadhaerens]|uniref:Uncharacterized protein n=1 Tax=Tautonia plasticadhaerens TaxID=2527974 RepID=A0A518GYK3_9BACT|nr:hypothetical protein [Tautonia plasticadhaerens]QDV33674.1 hypothetical protein ElP_15500 [Tautonia plasticadhaerens]